MHSLDILAAGATLLIVIVWAFNRGRSVSHIKGPGGAEWLVGHQIIITHQKEASLLEFKWFKEFGNVFRVKHAFNQDLLYIADPKALAYIFQTGTYRYPKTPDVISATNALFGGKGLISSIGQEHARQRKVLLPAFSAGQLRTFLGIFHDVCAKLSGKLNDMAGAEGSVVNVHEWLSRATLEVIGDSAFTYKFDSVEGDYKNTELGKAMSNLFVDSVLYPARTSILHNALIRMAPTPVVRLLDMMPSRQNDRFRQYFNLSVQVVRRIMAQRDLASIEESDRDVLSVLLRANAAENPSKRLSDTELISQLTLLIIAGHDTTGATLTWMLWELAKHPKIQERIRAEIREARKSTGGDKDFTGAEYDAMPFLNASIKETLRLHPIVVMLPRQAGEDDVLPLSEPLMTSNGLVTEIPISKNQAIHASLSSYNRLVSVWGEDADEFNPDRWLTMDWSKKEGVSVGMTSNLMSFSAGVQGCIGWKFAFMEAQAMSAHLVGKFEFNLPEDKPTVIRLPTGIMLPIVEGEFHKGIQMPLHIKPVTY